MSVCNEREEEEEKINSHRRKTNNESTPVDSPIDFDHRGVMFDGNDLLWKMETVDVFDEEVAVGV